MKKVLSVILSLIILALSTVSCSDQDDMPEPQSQTVVLSVQHSPDVSFDICNPFFFCHTGHNAFVQSENFVMEFISSPVRLTAENPIFIYISVFTPIWHPPKG